MLIFHKASREIEVITKGFKNLVDNKETMRTDLEKFLDNEEISFYFDSLEKYGKIEETIENL